MTDYAKMCDHPLIQDEQLPSLWLQFFMGVNGLTWTGEEWANGEN